MRKQEDERVRVAHDQNIAGIEAKLERGTEIIKKGHYMKINPEGIEMEIPFSEAKMSRMRASLYALLHPGRTKEPRPIPPHLRFGL